MSRLSRGLILSMVIGGALYAAIAAAYGDLSKVKDHVVHFPRLLLVAGLLLASLNYIFRFGKWQYYLAVLGVKIPMVASLGIFVSGFALTVTPGKIGEVLKSYLLKQRYGVPIARTAPIVIADRLTDLIALLLLGMLGVTTWMGRSERWLTLVGFGLCAALLLVVSSRRLAHACIDFIGVLPPRRLTGRIMPRLREFYDATALLVRPRALLVCTVLSVLAWSCECVAFFVVLRGFPEVAPTLLLAVFIYSMMTVAGALAFVPGGLGVTEGGMALLLTRLVVGMDQSAAVAATLISRVLTLWFAVFLGVIALVIVQRLGRVRVDLDKLDGEGPFVDASRGPG